MKMQFMWSSILMIPFFLTVNACNTIEGEALCGIWNTNSEYGKMKIEITPWKGKFHGYMLAYEYEGQKITGAKTEDFVILFDLTYQDGIYENGSIILDAEGKETCPISIKMTDKNQLVASYNCEGISSTEVWVREGHTIPSINKKNVVIPTQEPTPNTQTEAMSSDDIALKTNAIPQKGKAQVPPLPQNSTKTTSTNTSKDTKKHSAFKVIGIQKTVAYNNLQAMEAVIENLWNTVYKNDFSSQLNNIADKESMYLIYSNYDKPKGKMTITLGYKVNNLTNIPSGLNGVSVPTNEYYVSPLSGKASDYEGEAWKQFEELAAYRNAQSVDFEVYKFNEQYEVTEAHIWIAAV